MLDAHEIEDIMKEIIIPVNVSLGHTWLKRKLREAVNQAIAKKKDK